MKTASKTKSERGPRLPLIVGIYTHTREHTTACELSDSGDFASLMVDGKDCGTRPTIEQAHLEALRISKGAPKWRIARARSFPAICDDPVNYDQEIHLDLVSYDRRVSLATINELGQVLDCDTDDARDWLRESPDELDEVILFGPREQPCDRCGALTQAAFHRPDYLAHTGWICAACDAAMED